MNTTTDVVAHNEHSACTQAVEASKAIDGSMAHHLLFHLLDQAIGDVRSLFGAARHRDCSTKVTVIATWRQPAGCEQTTYTNLDGLEVAIDELEIMGREAVRIELVNAARNLRFAWEVEGNAGHFSYH
ncbi:hypothetical protein [Paraburkholderia sp. SIMBA_054]|uniref:hypothetical protein n=1 Tax=Paraburkholderia sp. SIMBA_054 TaxID=3085795 RepID=UPI00397DC940